MKEQFMLYSISLVNKSMIETDEDRILYASDVPRYYWSIQFNEREIYLGSNQKNICPKLFMSNSGMVFIGMEQSIYVIELASNKMISNVTDTTYVSAFQELSNSCVLASSEDELILFGRSGNIKWRRTFPEIIVNIIEKLGGMELVDMNDEIYFVDLETGKSRIHSS
jgi:hypothetical protein